MKENQLLMRNEELSVGDRLPRFVQCLVDVEDVLELEDFIKRALRNSRTANPIPINSCLKLIKDGRPKQL